MNLWDTLLKGMPIGVFYVQERPERDNTEEGRLEDRYGVGAWLEAARKPGQRKLLEQPKAGDRSTRFDLIDGQQRLRALLTGMLGPGPEGRIVWIRWIDAGFELRVTSVWQPFGYDKNGFRLAVSKRGDARKRLIEHGKADWHGLSAKDQDLKQIPDFDLFQRALQASGPIPPEAAYNHGWTPLHELFNTNEGTDPRLRHVETLQVALLKVEADSSHLLQLFDRIGAGGTPLQGSERYYSILKSALPGLANVVDRIYSTSGRIIAPADLAMAAIRIGRKQIDMKNDAANDVPNVENFYSAMREPAGKLKQSINALCEGRLSKAAKSLYSTMMFRRDDPADIGLPPSVIADLPKQLVHVLLFWATQNDTEIEDSRAELIRFVLFWRLCVSHEDRASRLAFRMIGEAHQSKLATFKSMYEALSASDYALALCEPADMEKAIGYGLFQDGAVWPSWKARFGEERKTDSIKPVHLKLASNWMHSRGHHLAWLQRSYLVRIEPNYDPVAGGEDDLPYDLDHILPSADWNASWAGKSFDQTLLNLRESALQHTRDEIGNAIGNFRLVHYSDNRHDGADQPDKKMEFLRGLRDETDRQNSDDMLLPIDQFKGWLRICRGPEQPPWGQERAQNFQDIVERRTVALYNEFYKQAGFAGWVVKIP